MAKKPDKEKDNEKSKIEAEIWNAISAFEQILDAMPNDRESLETLWGAYQQIGDNAKAKEYLVRLAKVIVSDGDAAAAAPLVEPLKVYAADDKKAADLLSKMEDLCASGGAPAGASDVAGTAEEIAHVGGAVRSTFNIADELSVAWNLLETKELSQEDYSSVVQDLTEMSAVENPSTVSVLHVLENRGFKNLERVMNHIAKECATPIISIACFQITPEVFNMLPLEFVIRRGAVVYEMLGKDALVVVMNPYDKQLRADVQAALGGRRCHFYVTLPSEFDKAVSGAVQAQQEKK